MAKPEKITVKVVLDTTEAEAQIAELQEKVTGGFAAGGPVPSFDPRKWTLPKPRTISTYVPHISGFAVEIAGKLDGQRLSPEDAEYLISCIRSRTY